MLHSDNIDISAEAVEININCVKELNLGILKGNAINKISYYMTNTGTYNAEFT